MLKRIVPKNKGEIFALGINDTKLDQDSIKEQSKGSKLNNEEK
jgi:hypothetical protein